MTSPLIHGLPHREPFLFIDNITNYIPGTEASGEKTFAANDPVFAGHFPGNPIVPGVLLTEALAQLSGIAATDGEGRSGFLLSAIRNMKFPNAARPCQKIALHTRKMADLGSLLQFEVTAQVESLTVATGQIVLNSVS